MRLFAVLLLWLIINVDAFSQPADAPDLDYTAVAESFTLPAGYNFGAVSGVAISSKGNVFVLNRGPHPIMEFEPGGRFVRSLGEGLFERPHGLRIDAEDNIWATDGGGHVVIKFNPQGRILLVLGVKGSAGELHEAGFLRLFNEPNDVAIGPAGEIFVTQGHGKGDSRVLKFDREGNFIKTWGGKGTAPGQFNVPHSIAVDSRGRLHVADRGNKRIQIFDMDGGFLEERVYFGTPCGLHINRDGNVYLANGHTGQIIKLDAAGKILGMTGKPGKGLGQFGEAHFIALGKRDDLYVADTLNWRVQKYMKK